MKISILVYKYDKINYVNEMTIFKIFKDKLVKVGLINNLILIKGD